MLRKYLGALLALALSLSPVMAQGVGQLGSGQVWGNSGAAQAIASPTSVSPLFDRALGATRGSILERGASAWAPVAPSATAGLPWLSNGTGADPGYSLLGIIGGGTNCSAASGTCLDNITGFSGTGFLKRTGAGAYSFVLPIDVASGGTGQTTAAAARAASGLNVESLHTTGDANVTIASTTRTEQTTTTLTAVRTWTLPAANSVNPGQDLRIADTAGAINGANTITVTAAGADTINGSATFSVASAHEVLTLISDGVSKWSFNPASASAGTVTNVAIQTAGGLTNTGNCNITTSGTCALYAPGGYLNRFRNGTLDVWQRGTSALATSATAPGNYTADGWIVQQTGAAFTCGRDTGNNGTAFSLQCVGGTSNTDTVIRQRIESMVAAPLAGATVTIQFRYKQDTGVSVTPKISTCFASATDNFATCTADLAATSLTACASATWCSESYTFNVSASAANGYEVKLDCNSALSSAQHCWITAADIRATPGVTTGVNANPPPPELRAISAETTFCLRYLVVYTNLGLGGNFSTLWMLGGTLTFPTAMRATPTLSNGSFTIFAGGGSAGSPQLTNATPLGGLINNVSNNWPTTAGSLFVSLSATFSAEL